MLVFADQQIATLPLQVQLKWGTGMVSQVEKDLRQWVNIIASGMLAKIRTKRTLGPEVHLP